MRLLRFAATAVLLAIPLMVAATPATYAAVSAGSGGSGGSGASARSAQDSSRGFATPATATPGARVMFTVNCDQGLNAGAADAILIGTTLGLPSRIPMNAINGSLFNFSISVTLPSTIQPGAYDPEIECPGGVGPANAELLVTAVPHGGAATGDGTTSTSTNGGLALGGLALIGVGALAGGFALRRRASAGPRGDGSA